MVSNTRKPCVWFGDTIPFPGVPSLLSCDSPLISWHSLVFHTAAVTPNEYFNSVYHTIRHSLLNAPDRLHKLLMHSFIVMYFFLLCNDRFCFWTRASNSSPRCHIMKLHPWETWPPGILRFRPLAADDLEVPLHTKIPLHPGLIIAHIVFQVKWNMSAAAISLLNQATLQAVCVVQKSFCTCQEMPMATRWWHHTS